MAARRRDLPEIAGGTLTSDGTNAADVVTQWVADGVTAVCARSDETGFIVLQGSWEANLQCPDDLAVIGVVADSLGALSVPPLTSVPFLADVIVDVVGRRDDGGLEYPADQEPSSTNVAHRWR